VHAPQLTTFPHPSDSMPQLAPASVQVFGWHVPTPHTSAFPPPPHVLPVGQVPHESAPPQPSVFMPQVASRLEHVAGTHLGWPPSW